uniref:C2H2-type domain-containing protein n=1 Tax=Neolamprologus brichardi TaxID=32507 RepID=A0A3Q4MHI3_NEOBR
PKLARPPLFSLRTNREVSPHQVMSVTSVGHPSSTLDSFLTLSNTAVIICSTTAFYSLPLFVSLSLQDQHGARSQRSQEADKPHRTKGEKRYSCDVCGKDFTHSSNLRHHQVTHSGVKAYIKPYSCYQCGKAFARSSNLQRHQVTHSGVKAYSCDECGKSFTLAASLKTHKVIHSGVKPYSCDQCGKAFADSRSLQSHKVIHSGIKAYSCDQCGKAFAHSSSLRGHKVIHSGIKAKHPQILSKM